MKEELFDTQKMYPGFKDGDYAPCDYTPMIESFGNVLLRIDDEAYQGDSRVILEKEGKYGLLIFGWGSCSGCDALQAVANHTELKELAESTFNNIKWFNNKAELLNYIETKDWELDYCYHCEETKVFISKAIDLLKD